MRDSLSEARRKMLGLVQENGISQHEKVHAEPLGVEEAIGDPSPYRDFPLLGGVEKLVDVTFRSSRGQAFSSCPCRWAGSLEEVFSLSLREEKNRAILIGTINALAREVGISSGTIHCRDREPDLCGGEIALSLAREFGESPVVGIVGYNPAIISNISTVFGPENFRLTDLNPENVGQFRFGVEVWHGRKDLERLALEADVVLVTGSALCNGTLDEVRETVELKGKPVIFFGTTIAGIADLLGYRRWCFRSC
ncbi:MAG TPA: DUF364 domain-containing protein [Synergistales bacterium]|nr:DUF364 domain-containing protein [Synergistales bacterium]